MARWLEHAADGTTTYSRSTRAASVVAGGALVFATLVGASTTAVATDDAPLAAARVAPEQAEPSGDAVVVGLIVEHSGSTQTLGRAMAGPLGVEGADVTAKDAGTSLVTFDEPTDVAEAERIAADVARTAGVTEVSLDALHTAQSLPPGGASPDQHFNRLHGLWDQRASLNYSSGSQQFNIKLPKGGFATKSPALWPLTKGSANTVVAVLDTGSTPHSDLDRNTIAGYDLISSANQAGDGDGRDANANDEGDWVAANECNNYFPGYGPHGESDSSWHGTHVAGTIAAVQDAHGVVGNAPGVKIQHVRVLGKCGGTTGDIADGITWASGGNVSGVPKNATPSKVLNLSLAGRVSCQPQMQSAINGARKRGAVVIVAAGNDAQDARNYQPANCKNVLTVGATDWVGGRASYSNKGPAVDLSAAGGDIGPWQALGDAGIYSTYNTGTHGQGSAAYASMNGTSMATPGVAGVAALVVSLRPKIKPAQLERVLRQSTRKFPKRPSHGSDNCASAKNCGKGIIDASLVPTKFVGKPKVTNVRVGRKAKVKATTVASGTKLKYQWQRNGKNIKGATKKAYKVKKSDRNKRISVRVTATHKGFPNSKATSKKVKAKKNAPKVSVALKKKTIKRKARARVTIKVNVGHLTKRPHGKVKVSYGKKSKTYTLKKSRKGKLTVKLPKLKKGTYTIRARYIPAKGLKKHVQAKNSKKIKLRVR